MKILIATTYIYDKEKPEFTKNKTGFGIMVNDIFSYISKKEDVSLISYVITNGYESGILKHKALNIFLNLKLKYLFEGLKLFFKYPQSLSGRLRYLYYCINKGYVKKTIKKLKPDIVHIHGISMATKTYIDVCKEIKVPVVVTLHGLIGLNETVAASAWNKQLEKDFLIEAKKDNIPVTVISTGIKNRIEKYYTNGKSENITVVTNATEYISNNNDVYVDLRKEYNIPPEAKICITIGNISENKNQLQIVEALSVLNNPLNYLFLCGNDQTNGELARKILELSMVNNVFPLGFVENSKVKNLIAQSDVNIFASINDGFGLSIIEAFMQGVPTVTFSDLDAVPDLYDEKVMLLSNSRETQSFANAIQNGLNTDWDKEYIKKYAERFTLDKMADNYIKIFEKQLMKGKKQ